MMYLRLRKAGVSLLRRVGLPRQFISTSPPTATPLSRYVKFPYQINYGSSWRTNHSDPPIWIILSVPAATILGLNFNYVLAEDVSIQTSSGSDVQGADFDGLRKVEDGSVISNGKLEQAEKFFLSALQEAKEGFGERDSHVASSCNNLAELYRVKKAFDKAEPLYLEAISILEEAFGSEDIRVGVALHNLGQFYLVQRKLEEAQMSYEVKRRVLGLNNIDYADTMYHLGMVLYLQGKLKDSEALMQDSVRILEEGGQGESMACIRRLRYLVQGWDSLDTVIAAEGLALTLQSSGSLKEAQELFERCLGVRKALLPEDHIQVVFSSYVEL
ncbi:Tetratricopeptide-like helical [Corchorus capsularis]|uniref:Tetratricopeptide-like helical n=1 Tax=Corchorus capsularis TaxID=210143 RepID=A0A1R3KE28_COCAP|nr:Tetratricopeptide-like helical [Corchorus capsularis]